MRVIAAIGLLISARIRKPVFKWLTAFSTIVGVHLLQFILTSVVLFGAQHVNNLVIGSVIAVIAIITLVLVYRKLHNALLTALGRALSRPE